MRMEERIADLEKHVLSIKESKINDFHLDGAHSQINKVPHQTLKIPTTSLGLPAQEAQIHVELYLSYFYADEIHEIHTSTT